MNNVKNMAVSMLLVALLLFSACTPDHSDETTRSTQDAPVFETQTSPGMMLEVLQFDSPEPENINPTAPSDPNLDFPVSWDPDRKIYFTCENWDIDMYLNSTYGPNFLFYIISEECVDAEDITITLPIETQYVVGLLERVDMRTLAYSNSNIGLPYFMYQIYQGVDWKTLGQMSTNALKAQKYYNEMMEQNDWMNMLPAELEALENSPEALHLKQVAKAVQDAENAMMPYYENISVEELPQFYLYLVRVDFDTTTVVDESFQTIDIDFGGTHYTQNIGEIRLHTEVCPAFQVNPVGISQQKFATDGLGAWPWTDGIERLQAFRFTADEDMVLTGAGVYEDKVGVLGAQVSITGSTETAMDFYWDLNTRIPISAGDRVEINMFIQDERMKAMNYGNYFFFCLDYELDGESHLYSVEVSAVTRQLPWLIYAVAFQGLDCESYFRDYYYPTWESWREELPWQVAP